MTRNPSSSRYGSGTIFCTQGATKTLGERSSTAYTSFPLVPHVPPFTMNASAMLGEATDAFHGYVEKAQPYLPSSPRMMLLGFVNLPVIVIALYVFWQMVRHFIRLHSVSLNSAFQIQPKSRTKPPVVFHWLPFIGSAISYGNDPINFLLNCRDKVIPFIFHVLLMNSLFAL